MGKKGILSAVLIGCALAAGAWTCDFESGLSQWKVYSKATPVQLIDDPDTAYGKVARITANHDLPGMNSDFFPVFAENAGKPWKIEFDLRSEGNISSGCTVSMQYFDAKRAKVGQHTLLYVKKGESAFGWKHFTASVGTGKNVIPENAAFASIRFGFWNKELDCTGTIAVDNVKVIPPEIEGTRWTSDFETGLKQWKVYSKATPLQVIDDPDATHGKVARITANHDTPGMNTEGIVIPAGSKGKPWIIEFDLRSEGNIQGSCTASMQYFDAKGSRVGQHPLLYVKKGESAFGWRSYYTTVGTGKYEIPEGAVTASLRFGFWNKELDCTGAIAVDNVKIQIPKGE